MRSCEPTVSAAFKTITENQTGKDLMTNLKTITQPTQPARMMLVAAGNPNYGDEDGMFSLDLFVYAHNRAEAIKLWRKHYGKEATDIEYTDINVWTVPDAPKKPKAIRWDDVVIAL